MLTILTILISLILIAILMLVSAILILIIANKKETETLHQPWSKDQIKHLKK